MKHTQGPWKITHVIPKFKNKFAYRIKRGNYATEVSIEADARLIAAAPELLEAIKVAYSHLHSEIGNKEYVVAVLLQAMDKAEGEQK